MIRVIFSENLIHLLAVGMFLCGFDGFGIFSLDGLNSVIVVLEGCNHLPNRLDVLNKLIVDSLLFLLIGLLFILVLIIEVLVRHRLAGNVKILTLRQIYLF